jgi:hypothetical protein
MSFPFFTTYLREAKIFLKLLEYEEQGKLKNLWEGEKVFLIWAGSESHQQIGTNVDNNHFKNAVDYCIEKKYISKDKEIELKNSALHVVNGLILHNFATKKNEVNPENVQILINEDGLLAGKILIDTNNLKSTFGYQIKYMLGKLKIETLFSAFAFIISIVSLLQGHRAINIAEREADFNQEANRIQSEDLNFNKDQRSQSYVENIYNFLYEDEGNSEIVQKIKSNETVEDINKLTFVVDYLESTGSSFCQGTVWKWHLNITLKNTLNDFCTNDQIFSKFDGRKNGLAILCAEFYPESKFASTLQTENLHTCTFHDSSVFKE